MELETALDYAATRRNATLITLRKDGRAQSSDIAFTVRDGQILISVTANRAKTKNIVRDPRVVLHISDPAGYTYLSFDCTAEVSAVASDPSDPVVDELVAIYRAIAKDEHSDWDEFRQAMIEEGRVVLTLTPDAVVGMINS